MEINCRWVDSLGYHHISRIQIIFIFKIHTRNKEMQLMMALSKEENFLTLSSCICQSCMCHSPVPCIPEPRTLTCSHVSTGATRVRTMWFYHRFRKESLCRCRWHTTWSPVGCCPPQQGFSTFPSLIQHSPSLASLASVEKLIQISSCFGICRFMSTQHRPRTVLPK